MRKGQSKIASLVEIVSNIVTGYFIGLLIQIIVFPWFGIQVTLFDNLAIGAIFSFVSVLRSFLFRRVFNYLTVKKFYETT